MVSTYRLALDTRKIVKVMDMTFGGVQHCLAFVGRAAYGYSLKIIMTNEHANGREESAAIYKINSTEPKSRFVFKHHLQDQILAM